MRFTQIIGIGVLAFVLPACSQLSQSAPSKVKGSAEEAFNAAHTAMTKGNYETALAGYEAIQAQFPMTRFAQQSLIESGYANYKNDEPDLALDQIDTYLRMYPDSPRRDYALYLRGLINYNRGGDLLDKIFPVSFSDLDNVRKKEAFHDFQKLITRHPESRYAVDAQKRLKVIANSIGQGELNVAKYYYNRGAYVAAFNRSDYVITHHQQTPAVVDALKVRYCSASKLKNKEVMQTTMRIIQLNFPKMRSISCSF